MTSFNKFHSTFLNSVSNKTLNWVHTDNEENFKIKRNKTGIYYCTYGANDFTYTFNSLGFRSDEFDNSVSPKILYSGCSITMGVGLPLEHIWCSQFNRMLYPNKRIPYLNLGVGGDSIAGVVRKIIVLLDTTNFVPDLVIINFPDKFRDEIFFLRDNNIIDNFLYLQHLINPGCSNFQKEIFNAWEKRPGSDIDKENETNFLLLDLFLRSRNIKYYVTSWDNQTNDALELFFNDHQRDLWGNLIQTGFRNDQIALRVGQTRTLPFKQTCGRDYLHSGPNSHFLLAELLMGKIGKDVLDHFK